MTMLSRLLLPSVFACCVVADSRLRGANILQNSTFEHSGAPTHNGALDPETEKAVVFGARGGQKEFEAVELPIVSSAGCATSLPEGPLPKVAKLSADKALPFGHPKSTFDYPKRDGFTLWLVEEFEEPLDLNTDPIWTWSDGGLSEGRVRFIKDAINFKDGKMILELRKEGLSQGDRCSHAEVDTVGHKELTSGEMRTRYNLFRYGFYEVNMRTPSVQPGNPWINGNYISTMFVFRDSKFRHWREIDIEVLAGGANEVTTNVINGDNQARWQSWMQDSGMRKPWNVNTRKDFHTYAFEWLPKKITWFINDEVVRTYVWGKVPVPDMSTKIMMNLWVYNGNRPVFGGKNVWANQYPMQAEYDWFRFYKWNGEDKYPCRAMDVSCVTGDDLFLASNNPCDGIDQRGVTPRGKCPCLAKCAFENR